MYSRKNKLHKWDKYWPTLLRTYYFLVSMLRSTLKAADENLPNFGNHDAKFAFHSAFKRPISTMSLQGGDVESMKLIV